MKRPKAVKPPIPEPVAGDLLDERLQEIITTGYPAEAPSASLQRRIADLIASHRSLHALDGASPSGNRGASRARQPQPSREPRYHRSEGLGRTAPGRKKRRSRPEASE